MAAVVPAAVADLEEAPTAVAVPAAVSAGREDIPAECTIWDGIPDPMVTAVDAASAA